MKVGGWGPNHCMMAEEKTRTVRGAHNTCGLWKALCVCVCACKHLQAKGNLEEVMSDNIDPNGVFAGKDEIFK